MSRDSDYQQRFDSRVATRAAVRKFRDESGNRLINSGLAGYSFVRGVEELDFLTGEMETLCREGQAHAWINDNKTTREEA